MIGVLGCVQPGEPTEILVLTGWNYEWAELSHRLAYLRVGLEPDSSLQLGLIGGDWSTGEQFSDAPAWRVRFEQVSTAYARAVRGEVRFDVGPDGHAESEVRLDGADLSGDVVAFLDGFEIDTDVPQPEGYPAEYDPALGYASNGFGFAAGTTSWDGDTIVVPVSADVRWGPQDRSDMNDAIPYAVTGVRVRVLVVSAQGPVADATPGASTGYAHDPPYTDQPPMTTSVEMDVGAEGFVGWSAFDLAANEEGPDAGEGDYLRAFGVEVEPTGDEGRAWTGDVTATMSNSSLSEYTEFHVGFSGSLRHVGVKDAEVSHYVVEGTHPVGAARTGPTLD